MDISGSAYDTELAQLCTAASRWIDATCADGLTDAFAASATASRNYDFDALASGVLHLDAPLLTLSALTNGDRSAITLADAVLLPRNTRSKRMLRLRSTALWMYELDGYITVTGVWGLYPSGSTPAAVEEAATQLVGFLFKRWQAALADASANAELGQLVYAEPMPKAAAAMLRPFSASAIL